jgi:ATP phosphoribosyltransferase regulatory subunit
MPQSLPRGIHDVLPQDARERRRISSEITECLFSHGYEPVVLPLFELSNVADAALGTLDPTDVLRFVEPDSGEIASLRADMTPQVARLVATRLSRFPGPYRIATEGIVVRRRAGRARKHRQLAQVGAELIGAPGEDADLEAITVACESVRRAGLRSFVLELSHAGVVSALLGDATTDVRAEVLLALAKKDVARVNLAARGLAHAKELVALCHTFGGQGALEKATNLLDGTPAREAIAELGRIVARAEREGVAPRIACDPGEVRHFAYYTGMRFSLFAEGPGEPLGGGGRYDTLTAMFGATLPAVGFALNPDHLAWALEHERGGAERCLHAHGGVVLVELLRSKATVLRNAGFRVVVMPDGERARAYAAAWGYSFVVAEDGVLGEVAQARTQDAETLRSLLGS